jgi:trans-aconitate methyltransferase
MESDAGYRAFHAPRYAYLLRLLDSIGVNDASRVLDIGESHFTEMARDRFRVKIDTLGFCADHAAEGGNRYEFDLNRAQDRTAWRTDLPKYDIVVMAEVLEHLHVAPQLTLGFVKTLLKPDSHLILQTPNAASMTKRLKLLLGRNPYEMIRSDPQNPGHLREYTVTELRALAAELGFVVDRCETAFYFDTRHIHDAQGRTVRYSRVGAARNWVYRILPAPFREGITMVLRPAG